MYESQSSKGMILTISQKGSRLYTVNNAFFDVWVPASAEVARFLYANGCVWKNLQTLAVAMKESDKEILVAMREAMKSTHDNIIYFAQFTDHPLINR